MENRISYPDVPGISIGREVPSPRGKLSLVSFTNVEILQRLIDRFDVQGYVRDPDKSFYLPHTIQPVTNIDALLKETKIATATKDLSGAAVPVTFFTVPNGKRWTLLWMNTSSLAGTGTGGIHDGTTQLNLWAATGTAKYIDYLTGIPLEEGWTIFREGTGNGGDNAEFTTILYEEEDAY